MEEENIGGSSMPIVLNNTRQSTLSYLHPYFFFYRVLQPNVGLLSSSTQHYVRAYRGMFFFSAWFIACILLDLLLVIDKPFIRECAWKELEKQEYTR